MGHVRGSTAIDRERGRDCDHGDKCVGEVASTSIECVAEVASRAVEDEAAPVAVEGGPSLRPKQAEVVAQVAPQ